MIYEIEASLELFNSRAYDLTVHFALGLDLVQQMHMAVKSFEKFLFVYFFFLNEA